MSKTRLWWNCSQRILQNERVAEEVSGKWQLKIYKMTGNFAISNYDNS